MSNRSSGVLPMHQRRQGTTTTTSSSSTRRNNNNNNNSMFGNSNGNGGRNGYDVEGGGSRRGRGGGGGNGGWSSGNDTNANIMEQQNNERISQLSDQVARLKGLTIDIGNEVREQNALLDNMGDGFTNTRDMLTGSLRRIGTMMETTGSKHMCYMVMFGVAVIIILWWLMKR